MGVQAAFVVAAGREIFVVRIGGRGGFLVRAVHEQLALGLATAGLAEEPDFGVERVLVGGSEVVGGDVKVSLKNEISR